MTNSREPKADAASSRVPVGQKRLEAASTSMKLAKIISWIGHPLTFVMVSVAIVVGTQLPSRAALSILAALFLSVILPIAVLLFLGVRSGRWRDADVSGREERKRFYPIAIPLSALGIVVTWLAGAPGYILRGGIITFVLLAISGLINLRFKLSLHTLFATYCAVILCRVNPFLGVTAFGLTTLVFWSRLFLKRHTLAETIAGTVFGLAGGLVTVAI